MDAGTRPSALRRRSPLQNPGRREPAVIVGLMCVSLLRAVREEDRRSRRRERERQRRLDALLGMSESSNGGAMERHLDSPPTT